MINYETTIFCLWQLCPFLRKRKNFWFSSKTRFLPSSHLVPCSVQLKSKMENVVSTEKSRKFYGQNTVLWTRRPGPRTPRAEGTDWRGLSANPPRGATRCNGVLITARIPLKLSIITLVRQDTGTERADRGRINPNH